MLNCKFLFIYGTLLDAKNEAGNFLQLNSRRYASGKVAGSLYDTGEYPAAVPASDSDHFIFGTVVELLNTEIVFPILDEYEGFGEKEEKPNLFVRELVSVTTEKGPLDCWMYVYNRSVVEFDLIAEGVFRKSFRE